MKKFEIVGNVTDTMCVVLGAKFTLGAAKKLADELMLEDMRLKVPKYFSIDVDDGRGKVLYTVTPEAVSASSLHKSLHSADAELEFE